MASSDPQKEEAGALAPASLNVNRVRPNGAPAAVAAAEAVGSDRSCLSEPSIRPGTSPLVAAEAEAAAAAADKAR